MAYTARRFGRKGGDHMPTKLDRDRRHLSTASGVRRDGDVLAALLVPEPVEAPPIASHRSWARTLRRFARLGVWVLPVYALAHGALGMLNVPQPDGGLQRYTAQLSADEFRLFYAAAAATGAWLGIIGLMALTALLAGTRAGGTATAGLLAGLAATVLALPLYGLGGFARPSAVWAYLRGVVTGSPADQTMYGSSTMIVAMVAGGLGTLAWFLAGVAVLRSRVLNRADGFLLITAAPLVGIGAVLFGPLATIGAILLLAGAIGLSWTGSRLAREPSWG